MIDLLKVMKRVKIPDLIIELMLLIYRFIVILIEISDNITTAQISRLGRRNVKSTLKSTASLMSVLFIHSIRKANRLYDAMESRNYDGRIIGIMDSKRLEYRDLIFMALYFLFLFIVWMI
jgi:cobalt/nickel transport system permease protein